MIAFTQRPPIHMQLRGLRPGGGLSPIFVKRTEKIVLSDRAFNHTPTGERSMNSLQRMRAFRNRFLSAREYGCLARWRRGRGSAHPGAERGCEGNPAGRLLRACRIVRSFLFKQTTFST